MNAKQRFACFLFLGWFTCLDGSRCFGSAREPTGGLVETALKPSELGESWTRAIRLVLDSQANPSTYYLSKDFMPGSPQKPVDRVDPAAPFRKELDQLGAEAAIYLAYSPKSPTNLVLLFRTNTRTSPLYVKILRFSTAAKAEAYWSDRQKIGESELLSIAGQEILATKPGKHLRPDLKASMETLECRSGRYLVRVAPLRPVLGDPGLDWVLRQVEKIRKLSEPDGAGNGSQPVSPQTNRPSPGSDR
jgi:hypothetical protein